MATLQNERLYKVLVGPLMTEKSAGPGDQTNQVVFKALKDATSAEIKAAIEKLFKVNVVNVNTLVVKGKMKRNKHGFSKKSDWKKAYVKLAPGQTIDFESMVA